MDEESREIDDIRLTSQAEVQRMWQLLIRPLGFSRHSLWVAFVAADGTPLKAMAEIEDTDGARDEQMITNLYEVFSRPAADFGAGTRLAFLISRPGRSPVGADDASFARLLLAGARRCGVPVEPIHLANDVEILPIAPDDLAA